jgi:hypothetical protein
MMVGLASANPGALLLLAQDGQPAADEAVEDAEQSRRGVLKVATPAPKHRVEISDDPLQAVATVTDRRASHCGL